MEASVSFRKQQREVKVQGSVVDPAAGWGKGGGVGEKQEIYAFVNSTKW